MYRLYYKDSHSKEPHLMFVGRWNPFHEGHKTLIKTTYQRNNEKPVLIMIRETWQDGSAFDRARPIIRWLNEEKIKGTIMIIPDIEGIYYGRKVGYKVERIKLDPEIEKISGTEIRKELKKK